MPDGNHVEVFEKFKKAYRSAGASQQGYYYSCGNCQRRYKSEGELLEHTKLAHRDHTDITDLEDQAEAKSKAYVTNVLIP